MSGKLQVARTNARLEYFRMNLWRNFLRPTKIYIDAELVVRAGAQILFSRKYAKLPARPSVPRRHKISRNRSIYETAAIKNNSFRNFKNFFHRKTKKRETHRTGLFSPVSDAREINFARRLRTEKKFLPPPLVSQMQSATTFDGKGRAFRRNWLWNANILF